MQKVIEQILKNHRFKIGVDLGCGEGRYSGLFKKHCEYLIGVDLDLPRLAVAKRFGYYDEIHWKDIRAFSIPADTEAIFMIEVIEHLSKRDGYVLLDRLIKVPFILITTPAVFFKAGLGGDQHLSLWTEDELRSLNFRIASDFYYLTSWKVLHTSLNGLLRRGIAAVRETKKNEQSLPPKNLNG